MAKRKRFRGRTEEPLRELDVAATEQKVRAELPDVAAQVADRGRVWDTEYYVETVG
jgi:hypothetical protein